METKPQPELSRHMKIMLLIMANREYLLCSRMMAGKMISLGVARKIGKGTYLPGRERSIKCELTKRGKELLQ